MGSEDGGGGRGFEEVEVEGESVAGVSRTETRRGGRGDLKS